MPLFVTHDPCLPMWGGIELLLDISEALAHRHKNGFFLLTRKALFIQEDDLAFTPIYVFWQGRISQQSLWLSSSPSLVRRNAEAEVDLLDKRFGNRNCMIPIAVNALDEGFVVADKAVLGQPWVSVGGPWRMPFVEKEHLHNLGIALKAGMQP